MKTKKLPNKKTKITTKKFRKISILNKKNKIFPETKLGKLMKQNPNAAEILFDSGMHCIGCAMASDESIEQGCLAHGMSKKQIQELIKKLNKQ